MDIQREYTSTRMTRCAVFGAMFLTIVLVSRGAAAQSCLSLVNDQFTYLDARAGSAVLATIATQQAPSRRNAPSLVSYTTGFLRATGWSLHCDKDGTACSYVRWLRNIQGGRQLLSDRTRLLSTPNVTQEFDARVPDSLGIFINTDANAYVQLNSWGGGVITLTGLQCNHNIMYGFDTNNVLYAITFSQYDPPPE